MMINDLLCQAHADFEELQSFHHKLLTKGVAAVDLPETPQLQAIALLGNHGRDEVAAQMLDVWSDLRNKSLVPYATEISEVSTPVLRLLSYARSALSDIPTIIDRLNSSVNPVPPSTLLLNVADAVEHFCWGQRVILTFKCRGAEALQISGDAIFGLETAILRSNERETLGGEVEFDADDGIIQFTVLSVTGDVFRKTVPVKTYQNLEAFYAEK